MQMIDIWPCDEPAFETADHESCKNSLREDQYNCRNKEIVDMDLLMENLDISDEVDLNDLLLEERQNLLVKKSICSSISNKKTLQFSSAATELKDLSDCAVILCSEALQSCPSIFAKVESTTVVLGFESYVAASNPAEDSLVSYHDYSKCVSALKGSRAQQGKHLDSKLHVTWAANVYDPPITLSSHTVKGHRYRSPKAKSYNHHKHKYMKTKPSNASSGGGDRKHSHRRSSSGTMDPRMARMQAFAKRSLQIEALDISEASGQESSKCAGSIHSESPWKLPLPIAEAS